MDSNSRKNPQITVALRVGLHAEMLRYTEVMGTSVSALANDIVESALIAVRADEPDRAILVVDQIRRALGKDAHRSLSEKYHRTLYGLQPPESEGTVWLAHANAGRSVPVMKEAKREGLLYTEARAKIFGLVESVLTAEIGDLYDSELMNLAAEEIYDPSETNAQNYFIRMANSHALLHKVHDLFLKDHLAREVVREIPRHFLPP